MKEFIQNRTNTTGIFAEFEGLAGLIFQMTIVTMVMSLAAYLSIAFFNLTWDLNSAQWMFWRLATIIATVWAISKVMVAFIDG